MSAPYPTSVTINAPIPVTPMNKIHERLRNLENLDSGDFIGAMHDASDFIDDLARQEHAYQERLDQVQRHATLLETELKQIRTIREGVKHAMSQLHGYDIYAEEKAEDTEYAKMRELKIREEMRHKAMVDARLRGVGGTS